MQCTMIPGRTKHNLLALTMVMRTISHIPSTRSLRDSILNDWAVVSEVWLNVDTKDELRSPVQASFFEFLPLC